MRKEFKEILKTLRSNSGMTQSQVATKIGVKEKTYQAYESGACMPSLERFVDLADLFDVSLDYLIGRKEY